MSVEISNLIAADRAFGAHIGACPWKSRLTALQDFNTRPIKEKIYRGDNDDPERFLKHLAKSLPANFKLPIVSYFRGVGFSLNMEDGLVFKKRLSNVEDSRHYDFEYGNYTFNYNVCIVGHGAASIHEVGLPLHRYLEKNKTFNIPYRLFRDEQANRAVKFNLPATISEPKNIPFDDATPKKENITQVYAANASYEVNVPMIWGEQVEPEFLDVEFMPMVLYEQ